ncbi:MAG TPA: hypothetical protein VKR30_03290 [Candidatus Limnocylindrales bacterium]|nr:hypothetical protein [Candidatus Limnocylindrales bacterium]
MTRRGALRAALVATFGHPGWWVLSLAAFLIRGGILVILLPIVVPPTVAGLMSSLAPTIVGAVLIGGPNTPVGIVAFALALVGLAFVAIAGTLGAWFEGALVDSTLADAALDDPDAVEDPGPSPRGLGTARLLPHVASAVVFVVAAKQIFDVAYTEATDPIAPSTPFLVRVLDQVPGQVLALVAVWLLAEAIGGLALREHLLEDGAGFERPLTAIGRAIRDLLRPRSILTLLVTDLGLLVIAIPGWLAAGRAWVELQALFADGSSFADLLTSELLFVAMLLGWLVLLGIGLAWRSVAATLLVADRRDRHADVS